ncbi:MAG: hypothetical protein IJA23_04265 [Clostridia bacterium]|nr:hypothetical protein [Clostridia bacterium]
MNKLLNIFSMLANDDEVGAVNEAYKAFIKIVNIVLPVLMSVILVLGMFYGIQLGVKYAKAEEDDDKKKARGQLINVIVGCLIAILFVAIVEIVLNQRFVEKLFRKVDDGIGNANTDY